jgi:hypothetical protein
MQTNKRERAMILVAVLVIVIAIVLKMPSGHAASTFQGPMLSRQEAEKKRADSLLTVKKMRVEDEAAQPRIVEMSYDLPAEQVQPRVVRELQKIAERVGVHFRQIRPLQPHKLKTAEGASVPTEVVFRAAFEPNVLSFLYYVEDPAAKMVVEKLNLTSADAKFKTVTVSAQITVLTRSTEGATSSDTGEANDVTKTNKT